MTQPISVARLGDFRPDFFVHAGKPKPKTAPFPFALGGKGLASAAGAANARRYIKFKRPSSSPVATTRVVFVPRARCVLSPRLGGC